MFEETDGSWIRVVFEKPFGSDLESARQLNGMICKVLREDQIFRIDHYLDKDSVQNILTFRFGNTIFEPIFNRSYVANVRITVAETIGMEGRRGGYYDKSGALRDIVTRSDEVEFAWRFTSSILEGWSKLPPPAFPNYEPGTQGPAEASRLLSPIQTRRQ